MKFRQLSWEYVACLTDGEGSIFLTGRASSRQVNINYTQCMANAWWLDHIKHFLISHGVVVADKYQTPKNGFTHRSLVICEQASTRICIENMLPWLILKEERAKEALTFLDAKDTARIRRERFCKYGHARTKRNTYVVPSTGSKCCEACRQLRRQGIDPTKLSAFKP